MSVKVDFVDYFRIALTSLSFNFVSMKQENDILKEMKNYLQIFLK